MMTRQDEGQISIAVTLSVTASLEATDEVVRAIEEFVMRNRYVRAVSATSGGMQPNFQVTGNKEQVTGELVSYHSVKQYDTLAG